MVVSFEIQNIEDLQLLLQLTKRLGISQVQTPPMSDFSSFSKEQHHAVAEINDEIESIFGKL